MRLYRKIPKRIAVKCIGKDRYNRLSKIPDIGDMIENCKYEKCRITKIVPVYSPNIRKNRVIIDFIVITDSETCKVCSFIHCCDLI